MNGEVQLCRRRREAVLDQVETTRKVLKVCIPGCEELERTEDNGFRAVAKMKVGPVPRPASKGRVTLSDSRPAQRLQDFGRRRGWGRRLRQGWRNGGVGPTRDGGTLLTYNVEAQIGGKLAPARPAA